MTEQSRRESEQEQLAEKAASGKSPVVLAGRKWLEVSGVNIKVKSITPERCPHATNKRQPTELNKKASISVPR